MRTFYSTIIGNLEFRRPKATRKFVWNRVGGLGDITGKLVTDLHRNGERGGNVGGRARVEGAEGLETGDGEATVPGSKESEQRLRG